MKTPLVILLVLSLAGNAVLAVMSLRSADTPKRSSPAVAAAAPVAATTTATAAPVVATPATAPAAAPSWQALRQGRDLPGFVANLRAAGFPPAVVRAMVRQMISDQQDRSSLERMPFWKQNMNNPEYQAAQAALANKAREQFEALLGADARPSASLDPATRLRRYGNLSDEKVDQLEVLNREYGELSSQLYAQRKTGDTQGTVAAQLATEEERRKEMAAILTPAEIEQYEMRSSTASSRVTAAVKDIEVSEQEFTELFRAQKAFEAADPLRTGQAPSVESMAKRNAAQDALNEQARTVLANDRFYEYLKGADPAYARAAQSMASHPSVTPAQTYELVKLEREYQAASMGLSRTAAGNPQAAASTFTTLRQEYQNSVNAIVGEEAGKAFVQRNRPGSAPAGSTGTVIFTPRPGGP